MRIFCLWCKQWLAESQICQVLPAGCLWPMGSALCITCCRHRFHGIPTDRQAD